MDYSIDLLKKLETLGALNYSVRKCISVLDIPEGDEKQFESDFNTPGSQPWKAFQKGIDKAEFAIDSGLFNKAKDGDLKAIAAYEERKEWQQKQEKTINEQRKIISEQQKNALVIDQKPQKESIRPSSGKSKVIRPPKNKVRNPKNPPTK